MDARTQFARTAADLVATDESVALVYAEISGQFFGEVEREHPDRVINVGIREQLLVNVGAGLALTGMRPIVHTFGSFLVERAFEQVKLGFGHQDVGRRARRFRRLVRHLLGRPHPPGAGRRRPAGHAARHLHPRPRQRGEVDAALRATVGGSGLHYVRVVGQANQDVHPFTPGRFHVVRRGAGATVIAVGPVLDAVLDATRDRDVTVLYASTVRPFDAEGLRAVLGTPDVVLVEPWLAGTSARHVAEALQDRPHRLLALGVPRVEHRHYGEPEEHIAAHGLDAAGIARSLEAFLAADSGGRGAELDGGRAAGAAN